MTSFNIFKIRLITVLIFTIFSSCSSSDNATDTTNTSPISILLDAQNTYTGLANQVFELNATVRNSDGDILNNQSLIWSSSNTNVATITNAGILKIISPGQVTITVTLGALEDSKSITIQFLPPNLIAFTVDELSNQLVTQGGSILTFLNEPTMSGIYSELEIGESSLSTTADRDQVYYFYEGSGTMLIDGQNVIVDEQSAIYVTAGLERTINSVANNMKVILLESKSTPSGSTSPYSSYSFAEMEAPRNANANIWNPFLNENTMLFGLYMLPQTIGGDSTLVHNWDELNIITSGSSLFQTDHGDVQVNKGSIVFVRSGNPHKFNTLTEDTDILIFWNM